MPYGQTLNNLFFFNSKVPASWHATLKRPAPVFHDSARFRGLPFKGGPKRETEASQRRPSSNGTPYVGVEMVEMVGLGLGWLVIGVWFFFERTEEKGWTFMCSEKEGCEMW